MRCDDCNRIADIRLFATKAVLCWKCLKRRQVIIAVIMDLGKGKPDGAFIPLSEITKKVNQRIGGD